MLFITSDQSMPAKSLAVAKPFSIILLFAVPHNTRSPIIISAHLVLPSVAALNIEKFYKLGGSP